MIDDGSSLLAKAVTHLLSPYASWDTVVKSLSEPVLAITDLSRRTAWLYLLSATAVAALLYVRRRQRDCLGSFLAFAFPADVYSHRSAIMDYKFVAIDMTIRTFIYVPLTTGIIIVTQKLLAPLTPSAADVARFNPLLATIAYTLVIALLADFGLFLYHYLMHRISILWHFHEVHHSAEVLTPVTSYRQHPLEELVGAVVGAIIMTIGVTGYRYVFGKPVPPMNVFGLNVVTFVFYMCAFQLRHSHIWLSYGPFLERFFISPAQHQIHHSADPRHWNKNYGVIFAFWDRIFGSLYVPKRREALRFGIPGLDPADYSSVFRFYYVPFGKAFGIPRLRRQASRVVSSGASFRP